MIHYVLTIIKKVNSKDIEHQKEVVTVDKNDDADIPHLDIYYLNQKLKNKKRFGFIEMSTSTNENDVFVPDLEYVKRINNPKSNSLWKAAVYEEFIGKSYEEMRLLLGGRRSAKNFSFNRLNKDESFLELGEKVD